MARPAQARAPATPTTMPAIGSRVASVGKSAATRTAVAAFSNHQGASRIWCWPPARGPAARARGA